MSGQSRPRILHLERIGDVFLNRLAALGARDLHDLLGYLSNVRGLDQLLGVGVRGAIVDGLNVVAQAVPDMTVQVGLGLAVIPAPGTTGVVPSPQTGADSNFLFVNKRLLTVAQPINPPPPGSFRWDLLEIGPGATEFVDDSQVVDLYDVPGKKFIPTATPQPVMTHDEGRVFYTPGAAGGTLPAPSPGRVPIAAVLVFAGMTAITQDRVFDLRVFLSELASRGRGDPPSELDVAELAIDAPAGGSPTAAQKFSCHARAVVRGRACGFSTSAAPLDLALGKDFLDFCDRNTRTRIFTGTAPDWLYAYLVAEDDQGFRLSRTDVPAIGVAPTGNRFSHAGVLVWSHVPPSLADGGSLAPSAPLAIPETYATGTVTPGKGHAVCVGCASYGATAFAFLTGVRSYRGQASTVAPAGFFVPVTPVPTAEVMVGSTGISAVQIGWPTSAPVGPLAYDALIVLTALNPVGAGAQRMFLFYEKDPGVPTVDAARAIVESSVHTGASSSRVATVVRGLEAGRMPSERSKRSGVSVICRVAYGSGGGGSGLSTVPANHAFSIVGWRWPQGPVKA
jgi:hypothetical protein